MSKDKFDAATFLSGSNAIFLDQLYSRYVNDPNSVDASWSSFFSQLGDEAHLVLQEAVGASWAPRPSQFANDDSQQSSPASDPKPSLEAIPRSMPQLAGQATNATLDAVRALMMIRVYRVRGHLMANLDPLGIDNSRQHPELNPEAYGFTKADYDRPIYLHGELDREKATLREILAILQETYCRSIGLEFMHIQDPQQKAWLQERAEARHTRPNADQKKKILLSLTKAESFERFLHVKYPGAKRFGLEGGESLIPALETILGVSGKRGVNDVVLGMAHRGRLNVLINIIGKEPRALFAEFQGKSSSPDDVQGSGDVKYHLGVSSDREFDGNMIHLSLTSNPSHLEAVDPVVVGKVRAKQTLSGDIDRSKVMGILLHGDAALAGQGLVSETLCMSELPGYSTGGTIHVVVNNQIGFTTSPHFSRSSAYCTDIAKGIQAPILHVNGDDPEAVVWAAALASEYRHAFKKDVFIDLFCYRRHGHNESDEPSFTQPLMYQVIRNKETTRSMYSNQLVGEGVLTEHESQGYADTCKAELQSEFEAANDYKPQKADWLEGAWSKINVATASNREVVTGISEQLLQEVSQALISTPDDFALHSKLRRSLDQKKQMFESGQGVDWATGEALAFGSLLAENIPVRLSGQDCGRGTFSHRHARLVDQKSAARYEPLNNIRSGQAHFEVLDSPLSEASVLGYELGYSLADPHALVLWEAQFGDFANGAQVIIDQFISSGEAKWLRMSGLVMLLPHGYEGQGPEHSSARLERYLQLCAEDNMHVLNCTTPANYFHALRRQMCLQYRKPLIVMSPKSLLRSKAATSNLSEFTGDTSFKRVIGEVNDQLVDAASIKRVVICSGKVYYDLAAQREKQQIKDIAIIRLEQFHPFPRRALSAELAKYPNADVIWCQEEHQNMGGWYFVDRRIEGVLTEINHKAARPQYVGRDEAAATATGLLSRHLEQQEKLIHEALTLSF